MVFTMKWYKVSVNESKEVFYFEAKNKSDALHVGFGVKTQEEFNELTVGEKQVTWGPIAKSSPELKKIMSAKDPDEVHCQECNEIHLWYRA